MNRPLTRQEWREHLDATWKQCTGQEHMNLEDITRMARESGLLLGYPFTWEQLEHFANLVAAAVRTECAQLVDDNAMACHNQLHRSLLQANADAIREME